MGAGGRDICKHARRSAENVVFYLHALINGNVVLNTNAIANMYIVTNVHILAQGAVGTDDIKAAFQPYIDFYDSLS